MPNISADVSTGQLKIGLGSGHVLFYVLFRQNRHEIGKTDGIGHTGI